MVSNFIRQHGSVRERRDGLRFLFLPWPLLLPLLSRSCLSGCCSDRCFGRNAVESAAQSLPRLELLKAASNQSWNRASESKILAKNSSHGRESNTREKQTKITVRIKWRLSKCWCMQLQAQLQPRTQTGPTHKAIRDSRSDATG